MKEFGAQLWYDLAAQAKRLRTRYLDMATEMAFLTERAYNAETGRGIHAVQYDYSRTASGNLMGADLLLADVDYFTYDLITTTKTRKQPVKTTISLADSYPMQFQLARVDRVLMFETALEDFDRAQPGLYLAKLRNVEVTLVGVTSATTVVGHAPQRRRLALPDSSDGTVVERLYPADVMVLSQFDLRAGRSGVPVHPERPSAVREQRHRDLVAARTSPVGERVRPVRHRRRAHRPVLRRVLRRRARDARCGRRCRRPGSASRAISMAMSFPDELFYLQNKGEGELIDRRRRCSRRTRRSRSARARP